MGRSGEFAAGNGTAAAPGAGQMYLFGPRGGVAEPGSALTEEQASSQAKNIERATRAPYDPRSAPAKPGKGQLAFKWPKKNAGAHELAGEKTPEDIAKHIRDKGWQVHSKGAVRVRGPARPTSGVGGTIENGPGRGSTYKDKDLHSMLRDKGGVDHLTNHLRGNLGDSITIPADGPTPDQEKRIRKAVHEAAQTYGRDRIGANQGQAKDWASIHEQAADDIAGQILSGDNHITQGWKARGVKEDGSEYRLGSSRRDKRYTANQNRPVPGPQTREEWDASNAEKLASPLTGLASGTTATRSISPETQHHVVKQQVLKWLSAPARTKKQTENRIKVRSTPGPNGEPSKHAVDFLNYSKKLRNVGADIAAGKTDVDDREAIAMHHALNFDTHATTRGVNDRSDAVLGDEPPFSTEADSKSTWGRSQKVVINPPTSQEYAEHFGNTDNHPLAGNHNQASLARAIHSHLARMTNADGSPHSMARLGSTSLEVLKSKLPETSMNIQNGGPGPKQHKTIQKALADTAVHFNSTMNANPSNPKTGSAANNSDPVESLGVLAPTNEVEELPGAQKTSLGDLPAVSPRVGRGNANRGSREPRISDEIEASLGIWSSGKKKKKKTSAPAPEDPNFKGNKKKFRPKKP